MSDTVQREPDVLDRLERARERVADVRSRIDEHGEETVEEVADAYRTATKLLETYVDKATGTGKENFKAYVRLEGKFESVVEGLPEGAPRRDAFEDALDAIDKRRLSESDFDRAREALEPAAAFADLLEERESARADRKEARIVARKRIDELEDEIAERERVRELATADLDAPVERLRDPIAAYNEAVREAFQEFRNEASARELFALLERSRWYPLVEYDRPSEELRSYVRDSPAGESTVPELLEYAGYSRSKLAHYVADADELKRRVATRQTYLEGIDAEPLTLEWPPRPAAELRYRSRERRPLVDRIADEAVLERLRTVRALTDDDEYDRLRTAAVAVERLTEDQRRRLASGRIAAELEELRAERERLRRALAD